MLALALVATTTMSVAYAQDASEPVEDEKPQHHQEMREALDNADYDAFRTVLENSFPLLKVYNDESLFDKLVEAHQLKEAGDLEGAKEIMDELGIKPHKKLKKMRNIKEKLDGEFPKFRGGQAQADTQ